MKITPASLTLNQLLSAPNEQYIIPAYQRRYSWHEKQVYELIDDVELLEGADSHLLGSIVCLSRVHVAGLNQLELVDGQQRLTTVSILFECIRKRLEKTKKELASEIARLLSASTIDGKQQLKIQLDSMDASEFERLMQSRDKGDFKNGELRHAFRLLRDWVDECSIDDLTQFLYRLQNQVFIVRLDVDHAKDAFKLFETINNRGLSLSPTDIIKNFLLGNAARLGEETLMNAREAWTKLTQLLDETNSDAFFRYFLTAHLKRRVTASSVVENFKILFMHVVTEAEGLPERQYYVEDSPGVDGDDNGDDTEGDNVDDEDEDEDAFMNTTGKKSFSDFLGQMTSSARIYGQLVLAKTGKAKIDRHLRQLNMIKAAQTYGYLMHLSVGGCNDKDFINILELTEAFLLRRHICKERANETEQLFAKLCAVDPKSPVAKTQQEYRKATPPDSKFRQEFANAKFTANIIDRARYCLEAIELHLRSKHGELQVLGSDSVHVEHIIPQKIITKKAKDEFGDWVTYLGDAAEELHADYVSRIGNLTLFAGSLNIAASNSPFGKKKKAYKKSAILITQELGAMSNFRFDQVISRSTRFADMALEIWPSA